MKQRSIGLFLAVVMLASVLCIGVSAQGELTTSDQAITILKAEEGFSAKPYWDYAQWTVGYGTKCPDDMLEYYKQYGITEAEAESLLRTYLTQFENELHKFMNRTGVELNQNQFDALLLFTYNCGSGWSYSTSGIFYNAIVSGAAGNELINAFSRWCSAGGQILTGLLRRRLCEANMYLNGVYSQTVPENFGYVLYDGNGGKASPTVQGYHTELTADIIPVPTWEGYNFAGWYTDKTGGTRVEKLDASVRNARLYARWTDAEGNDAHTPEQGVTVTVTASGVNLRSGAGTNHSVVGVANKGDQFLITQTQTDENYTWGKFAAGWICLDFTDYEVPEQEPDDTRPPVTEPSVPEQTEPAPQTQMGTVKVADTLRIRSGPSTGYAVAGYLHNGDRVEILEQQIAGSMVWGRIEKGWISLSYVTLDEVQTPQTDTSAAIATGTVQVNASLRVRTGPGTSYSVAGYLTNGTKVSILETKQSESMTWGKIREGWISLSYVILDKQEAQTPETVFGTVKVSDYLRIRSGAGTSYAVSGYLSNGERVEVLEQKNLGSTLWGRVEKGWISLDYVELDGQTAEPQKVIKTVTADCLRIRSDAGTAYQIVGYLYQDAKVEILETKTVDGTQWGKTAKGWISMDYVK